MPFIYVLHRLRRAALPGVPQCRPGNHPVIITDGEPAEISIIENLLRENLIAIEEAEAIERLRVLHDYGLADVGRALGKAESTMSEILLLNHFVGESTRRGVSEDEAAQVSKSVV